MSLTRHLTIIPLFLYVASALVIFCMALQAPEQFEGCSVTDKVDVFAFGVLLWECFEQQQPWRELSPMQIIYSVGLQVSTHSDCGTVTQADLMKPHNQS